MWDWLSELSAGALREARAVGDGIAVVGAAPYVLMGAMALMLRAALGRVRVTPAVAALRDVLLMVPAVLLYFLARGAAEVRPDDAVAHAQGIVALERSLGVFLEPVLQRRVLGSGLAVDLVNWAYIFGHWPVLAATFVWLTLRHRSRMPVYRDAIVLSGSVGILVFLSYPVAPPRFLTEYGFVDTVLLHTRAYRVLQPPALTDLYAAVPSLHVGWNLVMGIALVRESSVRAVRAFGVVMPGVMAAAVVLTANHFFTDVLLGVALVTVCLRVSDRGRAPDPAAEEAPPGAETAAAEA